MGSILLQDSYDKYKIYDGNFDSLSRNQKIKLIRVKRVKKIPLTQNEKESVIRRPP